MEWDSTCSTSTNSSASSSACIGPRSMREPVSVWPSFNASSTATAGASGRKRPSTRARHSTLLSKEQLPMLEKSVEILLVEDNPNDVELTLHAFRKHNLANRVHVARDGAEALDFLFRTGAYKDRHTQNSPHVVLLDLKLPKVNGLEVLQRMKEDAHIRMIPVVVLTSSREDRDITECYRLGVNSYIVKPVNFEQFTEAVRQLGLYWLLMNEPRPVPREPL